MVNKAVNQISRHRPDKHTPQVHNEKIIDRSLSFIATKYLVEGVLQKYKLKINGKFWN